MGDRRPALRCPAVRRRLSPSGCKTCDWTSRQAARAAIPCARRAARNRRAGEVVRKLLRAASPREQATPEALVARRARGERRDRPRSPCWTSALSLAPNLACATWKAHALLRNKTLVKRWQLAREAVQRALALDPGLIVARRLRPGCSRKRALVSGARGALETWLERTGRRGDRRAASAERKPRSICAPCVLDGDPQHGRELLAHPEAAPRIRIDGSRARGGGGGDGDASASEDGSGPPRAGRAPGSLAARAAGAPAAVLARQPGRANELWAKSSLERRELPISDPPARHAREALARARGSQGAPGADDDRRRAARRLRTAFAPGTRCSARSARVSSCSSA